MLFIEPYEKCAEIFSKITHRKIKVVLSNDFNFKTDGVEITLPSPISSLFKNWSIYYTGFEHELAHIVFNSDSRIRGKEVSKLVRGWKQVGNNLFDIIEDIRVNSLWGCLYLGSQKRLDKVYNTVTTSILESNPDIFNLATKDIQQFVRIIALLVYGAEPANDTQKWFKDTIEQVKFKSFEATVVIWKLVMKKIQELFNKMTEEQHKTEEKEIQKGEWQLKKENSAHAICEINRELEKIKRYNDSGSLYSTSQKTDTALIKHISQEAEEQEENLPQLLEKCEKNAQKQVNKVIRQLERVERTTLSEQEIKESPIETNKWNDANFDEKELQQKAMLLKKVIHKYSKRSDLGLIEQGEELNIDSYIQFIINKKDSCIFKDNKFERGILVLCLLDISGSMQEAHKCKYTAEVCALLQLCLKRTARFEVFTYGTHNHTDKSLANVKINRCDYKELLKLYAYSDSLTPTQHALDWIRKYGKQNQYYQKKLILLITDGSPYFPAHTHEKSIEETRQEVAKIKQNAYYFYAINIRYYLSRGYPELKQNCDYMYGKNFYSIIEPEQIKIEVMRYIIGSILRIVK
jgi:uncharacterized protein YegL